MLGELLSGMPRMLQHLHAEDAAVDAFQGLCQALFDVIYARRGLGADAIGCCCWSLQPQGQSGPHTRPALRVELLKHIPVARCGMF